MLIYYNLKYFFTTTGAFANCGRNAIVNISEIVCYDVIKESILKSGMMGDTISCHFTSAVAAGKYSHLGLGTDLNIIDSAQGIQREFNKLILRSNIVMII